MIGPDGTALPACARCRSVISEDDSDVLIVYSNTEREVAETGDLGTVVEAYCASCTSDIEQAHRVYDEEVRALRQALNGLPTYRRHMRGSSDG